MSTTPMQRPFLVGSVSARHDRPSSVSLGHGLYLVPALNPRKKRPNAFQADFYKIAAVGAALFLVFTI